MRKINKIIRNFKTLYKNKKKIHDIQIDIKNVLGDVEFKFASFGGADINYFLLKNKKKFAMLRLAVLDKEDTTLPIVRFNKSKRLTKEYSAYNLGSPHHLTPQVLYYSTDALVCEYLDGERVFDVLQKDKSKVWDILIEAIQTYKKLHDLGIVHLDATLKNFVMDGNQMKVIDFEYYPGIVEFSLAEQKAYDYVRIIEHTLRSIPSEYQQNYYQLINYLDKILPDEIKDANFNYVKPWIINIQKYPIYLELKEKIFINLTFE